MYILHNVSSDTSSDIEVSNGLHVVIANILRNSIWPYFNIELL